MAGLDEVDNIIIVTLRQIGCDIPDEITTLKSFTSEIVVQATSRCLKAIDENNSELPSKLPSNMSARFRVGTDLADACKALKYRSEIGYQTFLYPNEGDMRGLFMFLVERLPKESSEVTSEPMSSFALLRRAIGAEMAHCLTRPWIPHQVKRDSQFWPFRTNLVEAPSGIGDLTVPLPKEKKKYYNGANLNVLTSQPSATRDVTASVLENNALGVTAAAEWETEWNNLGLKSRLSEEEYRLKKREKIQKKIADQLRASMQLATGAAGFASDFQQLVSSFGGRESALGKGSRFTHAEKLQFAKDSEKSGLFEEKPPVETEEEVKQKRADEVSELQTRLDELTSKLESMDIDIKKFTVNAARIAELTSTAEAANRELEDAYRVKKKTMEMLPEADKNIEKLQQLVNSTAQRLVALAEKWESHRVPLIAKYRELKELNETRMGESAKRLEEIRELRQRMKEIAEETRKKDELYNQLAKELERQKKDVNRSSYTRRIMEIVSNIRKQRKDIDRVLMDTRRLQQEINLLDGKLDRTFVVTDEQIFKDAKKDEACRTAYKHLAKLHETCGGIVTSVIETGTVLREIRELEEQIETERQKSVTASLQRITDDLKQMKQENSALVAKIKGK
ncbi:coiled-coil domain-containing protein 22 homolog [Oscarella lobularis]|uniref:coiled-coil domain-containing protein 22 homolog n=1 Tax=Oscarella lobularis TaxID=121494 RepID=UPI0033138C79